MFFHSDIHNNSILQAQLQSHGYCFGILQDTAVNVQRGGLSGFYTAVFQTFAVILTKMQCTLRQNWHIISTFLIYESTIDRHAKKLSNIFSKPSKQGVCFSDCNHGKKYANVINNDYNECEKSMEFMCSSAERHGSVQVDNSALKKRTISAVTTLWWQERRGFSFKRQTF